MNIITPRSSKIITLGDSLKPIKGRFQILGLKPGTYRPGVAPRPEDIISVSPWIDNLVMEGTNTGINLIIRAMAGELPGTTPLNLTKAKIGTGTSAPADGNTDLGTPTITFDRTFVSYTTNAITFEFFVNSATLPNDSYDEFGVFYDENGTLRIFSRALISPAYTKGTNQDTQINYQYTLTN